MGMSNLLPVLLLANTVLLFATLGGLLHLLFKSRNWTGPALAEVMLAIQEELSQLKRRDTTHEQQINVLFTTMHAGEESLINALRALTDRVEEMITLKHEFRGINNRLEHVEQEQETTATILRTLSCAEKNWHEGEYPGICPLHKTACPLNGKEKK
jgi:hypothetical protein